MKVTVAICTAGRPAACAQAVRDVLEQLPRDGECLVIDQSSEEQHRALRESLAGDRRLRLLASPIRELPHARNLALSLAEGEAIVFFDDDVRLRPGVVEGLVRTLGLPGVHGAGPRIRERVVLPNRPAVVNEVGPGGRVLTNMDGPGNQDIGSLKGCAMAFRRDPLREVGGFDRRFRGTAFLEDADASERVKARGGALRFVGEVSVDHLSVPSGGVRLPRAVHQWWRFHNTALYVGAHRGPLARRRCRLTFEVIALQLACRWHRPSAIAALREAWSSGEATSKTPPALWWAHEPPPRPPLRSLDDTG